MLLKVKSYKGTQVIKRYKVIKGTKVIYKKAPHKATNQVQLFLVGHCAYSMIGDIV